jgi:TolB protein
VEIVVNGRVVQTLEGFDGKGSRTYEGALDLPAGGWLAARAVGGKTAWPVMSYAHFAHTQPIWIGQMGSVEPAVARAAAEDLLAALKYSESRYGESYGKSVPPG